MSAGIQAWAGEMGAELDWSAGTGDQQLRGYIRADGACAIETNGDPVYDGDEGFEELWAAHYWAEVVS